MTWDLIWIHSMSNHGWRGYSQNAGILVALVEIIATSPWSWWVNTLRPRQNGRRFADDTFKCIFLNENVRISIKISLKFVPKISINNIPALVQIMAWRRLGDKPLSEPMMVGLLTHIYVTRPQWIKEKGHHARCCLVTADNEGPHFDSLNT